VVRSSHAALTGVHRSPSATVPGAAKGAGGIGVPTHSDERIDAFEFRWRSCWNTVDDELEARVPHGTVSLEMRKRKSMCCSTWRNGADDGQRADRVRAGLRLFYRCALRVQRIE